MYHSSLCHSYTSRSTTRVAVSLLVGCVSTGMASSQVLGGRSQCKEFLDSMRERSDADFAMLCRAQLPTNICREASWALGEQPWADGVLDTTCSHWESRWSPQLLKLAARGRDLKDVTFHKSSTDQGVKTKGDGKPWNPWAKPTKNSNPFGSARNLAPLQVLKSIGQSSPPTTAWMRRWQKVTTTPAPSGPAVTGGVLLDVTKGDTAKAKEAALKPIKKAIAEVAGVPVDKVTLSLATKPGKTLLASFTIKPSSKVEMIAITNNFVTTTPWLFETVLTPFLKKSGENYLLAVSSTSVADSYTVPNRRRRTHDLIKIRRTQKAPRIQSANVNLNDTVASILGSMLCECGDSDLLRANSKAQGVFKNTIAEGMDVKPNRVEVTAVQLTPTTLFSKHGFVEVFFTASASNDTEAKAVIETANRMHLEVLDAIFARGLRLNKLNMTVKTANFMVASKEAVKKSLGLTSTAPEADPIGAWAVRVGEVAQDGALRRAGTEASLWTALGGSLAALVLLGFVARRRCSQRVWSGLEPVSLEDEGSASLIAE